MGVKYSLVSGIVLALTLLGAVQGYATEYGGPRSDPSRCDALILEADSPMVDWKRVTSGQEAADCLHAVLVKVGWDSIEPWLRDNGFDATRIEHSGSIIKKNVSVFWSIKKNGLRHSDGITSFWTKFIAYGENYSLLEWDDGSIIVLQNYLIL